MCYSIPNMTTAKLHTLSTPRWVRVHLKAIGYNYCSVCHAAVPLADMTKGNTGRCKPCTAYHTKLSKVARNARKAYQPITPEQRVDPRLGGLAEIRRLLGVGQ